MEVVYINGEPPAPPIPEQRWDPMPMHPNIRAVKEVARIEEVSRDYGEFKPAGTGRLLGRCVSSTHKDETPSQTIYLEDQRFRCYGCQEHGDVLDLVMLAEGCELHEALLILARRYGVELPGRPDSWYAKQERQRGIREALDGLRVRIVRKRLYAIVEPMILDIEDGALREEVARDIWAQLRPWAEDLLLKRGAR